MTNDLLTLHLSTVSAGAAGIVGDEAQLLKSYYDIASNENYYNESLEVPLPPRITRRFEAFDNICTGQPLTNIDTTSYTHATNSSTSSHSIYPLYYKDPCWDMREDVKDKPGFVVESEHCYGKPIIFNVTFGLNPQLTLVFLRSYEDHYGVVSLWAYPLKNDSDTSLPPLLFYSKVTNATFEYPIRMGQVDSRFDSKSNGDSQNISISKVATFFTGFDEKEAKKGLLSQLDHEPHQHRHQHHQHRRRIAGGGDYLLNPRVFPPMSSFLIKIELLEFPKTTGKKDAKPIKGGKKFKFMSLSTC
jgi:hypothetical protein